MTTMRLAWISGLLVCMLVTRAAHAEAVTITHQPVGCVVAGKFALLEARFDPADQVARARVYFQGQGTSAWYFVDMKPQADAFQGTLPKATKNLKGINYYIEVLDRAAAGSRTADFSPEVVGDAGVCGKGVAVAGVAASASVAVGTAAGAPAIPAGFASSGVTSATAAGSTGAAGAGGHTALYVVGGLVTAAGTVAVASELTGKNNNITMEGNVYVAIPGSNPGAPGPIGSPIQGAVLSTTLDATTATTDAAGAFTLMTSTPSSKGQGITFTLTIRASGCQTYQQSGNWGDHSKGQVFTLRCP